ncbi:hypothetical protein C8J36_10222 [Rhizobium sp. PP-F2F-G48]|nr:hypothetical protein [Rhizobium sp. PP-F2F-G48]TCM57236.1 hypothetical protein C8J36_10222 [Rhizobium sp. PP-F2F-G48]
MAVVMMIVSAVISIVFLFDFTKTILQLKRDREAIQASRRHSEGFSI